MKMKRNFDEFTDFESLELKVPTFYFVTGCVSVYRDRRYIVGTIDRRQKIIQYCNSILYVGPLLLRQI
jgi:hypothetical protein